MRNKKLNEYVIGGIKYFIPGPVPKEKWLFPSIRETTAPDDERDLIYYNNSMNVDIRGIIGLE